MAKWLSEKALKVAEKRREAKGKGEKKKAHLRTFLTAQSPEMQQTLV